MNLYHVAKDYDGSNLLSLYEQYKDEAYEIFAEKWPESSNLGQYHAHYIHLHDNLDDAKDFAKTYGGKVLEINADELEVKIDNLEYPHPMVKDYIPVEYIKEVND